MKRLPLQSPAYRYIEKSFAEWLDVLGYAEDTVYSMPNYIRGLLHYIEQQGKTEVRHITKELIKAYYHQHLKHRPNMLYHTGGLSNNHLNKNLQALYKFCDYLRQSGRLTISPLNIKQELRNNPTPAVLTEPEIKQLYQACNQYPEGTQHRKPNWFYPAMALRDKAMLTIYYSCGLRRNEGLHIELNDILWDKQLLHVRKGKNYKERFVPINKTGIKHLENYLYDARPLLIKQHKEERFFINERGKPMKGQSMLLRLNQLVSRTENTLLQQKEIGLHTLRHSIATHLLANGMKLERIKDFLGHTSLESTQIYTHLITQEQAPCTP
jgi:integrase/recombinase XerD